MTHQQVLTGIEVDNMQRERPTKTRIFCTEITKFETPINAQQQLSKMSKILNKKGTKKRIAGKKKGGKNQNRLSPSMNKQPGMLQSAAVYKLVFSQCVKLVATRRSS